MVTYGHNRHDFERKREMIDTTYQRWSEKERLARGLLNGKRVQLAREFRGIVRYALARKLGIAAKELQKREQGWHFWEEAEQESLEKATDFPLAFFAQDDPFEFTGPIFYSGHDEDGEHWCDVDMKGK